MDATGPHNSETASQYVTADKPDTTAAFPISQEIEIESNPNLTANPNPPPHTRDAIAALRVLYERNQEYNNKVYVCYVDYEKASDRVDWTRLMTILRNIGVNWRDRKLIWNLYNKQVANVRTEDGLFTACTVGRGVRQGCSLSPLLYLVYDEAMPMTGEATDNTETEISVGGRIINAIDDKAVVANSQKGLQQLMLILWAQ